MKKPLSADVPGVIAPKMHQLLMRSFTPLVHVPTAAKLILNPVNHKLM